MRAKREKSTDNDHSNDDDDDDEEVSLLSIPKLLLRRASTQLGFGGSRNTTEKPESEMILLVETEDVEDHGDNIGDQSIAEETEEEIVGENTVFEVKSNKPPVLIVLCTFRS